MKIFGINLGLSLLQKELLSIIKEIPLDEWKYSLISVGAYKEYRVFHVGHNNRLRITFYTQDKHVLNVETVSINGNEYYISWIFEKKLKPVIEKMYANVIKKAENELYNEIENIRKEFVK